MENSERGGVAAHSMKEQPESWYVCFCTSRTCEDRSSILGFGKGQLDFDPSQTQNLRGAKRDAVWNWEQLHWGSLLVAVPRRAGFNFSLAYCSNAQAPEAGAP